MPTAPYDPCETVLNFARVIANDCAISLAGNLLADSQPYTFTMLNLAWRKLQDRLVNNSLENFPVELIISAIPAQVGAALQDPSIQSRLGFDGYADGNPNSLNAAFVLPQDLELPIKLWERPTGQNAQHVEMFPVSDGLPSRAKSTMLREWEWRDDSLWFVGASASVDLRLRYQREIADMVADGQTPVPLLEAAVPLAYLVVEIFAMGRGSTVTQQFGIEKENSIKDLINKTTRKKQRGNFRRQPYSRRGDRTSFRQF